VRALLALAQHQTNFFEFSTFFNSSEANLAIEKVMLSSPPVADLNLLVKLPRTVEF